MSDSKGRIEALRILWQREHRQRDLYLQQRALSQTAINVCDQTIALIEAELRNLGGEPPASWSSPCVTCRQPLDTEGYCLNPECPQVKSQSWDE